jgi:hypothetical protein
MISRDTSQRAPSVSKGEGNASSHLTHIARFLHAYDQSITQVDRARRKGPPKGDISYRVLLPLPRKSPTALSCSAKPSPRRK